MIAWGREERPPSLKRDGGVSAARSSGPQASPSPTTPELAPRPRDPVPVLAADAFALLFLPPALSLVHPPRLVPSSLDTCHPHPCQGFREPSRPPPLSPPDGNNDADDQRSVEDTMEPLSEDDRPRATQSALLSSPPPRTRRGGEGGAQNTLSLPGSRSRSVRCLRTVIPCLRRPRGGSARGAGFRTRMQRRNR